MITANLFMFVILAVVILGSAIMCVFTKRIMRAATFLLFVLFGVAGMFFLLDYTYWVQLRFLYMPVVSPCFMSSLSSCIKAYSPGSFGACQG